MYDQYKFLINTGMSDDEDDDELKETGAKEDNQEEKRVSNEVVALDQMTEDTRMIVDSTALPSDNGVAMTYRTHNMHEHVEKMGSNRFQVQVSEKDIEKIKSDC